MEAFMKEKFILVVNDDPNSGKLFKTYATRAGYESLAVGSAEQALIYLEIGHPDLIILDIELPGINGIALLQRLKANPTTRDIHVIVTTVYYEHYTRKQIIEAGADDFLVVPAERDEVMALVESTISAIVKKLS
jgi:CheY-like chemotaxis protein